MEPIHPERDRSETRVYQPKKNRKERRYAEKLERKWAKHTRTILQ